MNVKEPSKFVAVIVVVAVVLIVGGLLTWLFIASNNNSSSGDSDTASNSSNGTEDTTGLTTTKFGNNDTVAVSFNGDWSLSESGENITLTRKINKNSYTLAFSIYAYDKFDRDRSDDQTEKYSAYTNITASDHELTIITSSEEGAKTPQDFAYVSSCGVVSYGGCSIKLGPDSYLYVMLAKGSGKTVGGLDFSAADDKQALDEMVTIVGTLNY